MISILSRGALRLLPQDRRQTGSYTETPFEEVIEATRLGTWTINAGTGKVVTGTDNPSHTNRRIKTNDFEMNSERWKARLLFTAT